MGLVDKMTTMVLHQSHDTVTLVFALISYFAIVVSFIVMFHWQLISVLCNGRQYCFYLIAES